MMMIDTPPIPADRLAIRRATVADAAAVSRIATRTFTQTFGHLYPAEDLKSFNDENYSVERQTVILGHRDYAIWLLEHDGEAVGHAAAGPCGLPHPQATTADGELKRLYVLPGLQGGGWGGRLCQLALDWLEREGPRTLWLSVWSQNRGAQRFYARRGFEKAGEYEFPVGRVRDHEFMFRRLANRG